MDNPINTSWHSFPSIYNLGHAALGSLLDGEVLVEEKVDGSQFSFGRFGDTLRVRSKGKEIFLDAPEKMFLKAIEYVQSIQHLLHDGWTYRAEYLNKPKHNSLAYDRIPANFLILFDVNTSPETYLSYEDKKIEAARIGLEVVPVFFKGTLNSYEQFQSFLETKSILGGQKIEGVVVKNYAQFGRDKKVLMGKFVSEHFKEVHQGDWKECNPGQNDIITQLIKQYRTPARWQKAVQHLTEAGALEGTPKDIGVLMKEVSQDILKECGEEIMDILKKGEWPKVHRGCVAGLPEWYKEQLAKKQFE